MRVAVYQLNKELAKSEAILIDEGKDLSTANAKLYEEVLNTETECVTKLMKIYQELVLNK